ncbi:2-phospho-L-lactate guanylyltransferase [Gordonia alkaliphila]|uniref:2-phospho-L-lactate guanylyltransferase n=1 Tax=Gordonia alkaliphila TaxID=1053547 RepID=UPI001FF6F025|nr:2-phospho-L-lactate guanylyltransferase [Gordonia alkaliphila]MCK0437994.1 2-phospho-L-lactate guanylyltransferase [Gordonia alkaliphila]
MSDGVTVVLALKALRHAKSRLGDEYHPAADRERLVAAMFADTVDAVRSAGRHDVVVVSPDPQVRELTRSLGARAVDDPGGGLNAALARGAVGAGGTVVYLQADLPALRAESFAVAVAAAGRLPAAFVADRHGTGTALLTVAAGAAFTPAFGSDSAAAHRAAGAVELDPSGTRWPDLRCDVDTPDDLRAAIVLGVGRRTDAAMLVAQSDAAHKPGE